MIPISVSQILLKFPVVQSSVRHDIYVIISEETKFAIKKYYHISYHFYLAI